MAGRDLALRVSVAFVEKDVAGFERELDGCAPLAAVDEQLVRRELRIEIAVVLRRAYERSFDVFVRAVMQA